MKPSELIGIGKIVKTHGIHGELIIEAIDSEIFENIEGPVFIIIDGLPVPFFIKNASPTTSTRFRVSLKWIDSETKAKALINTPIFAPSGSLSISESQFNQSPNLLIGFNVSDLHYGLLGPVTGILYQNNNPLLAIQHPKAEILVPLHPDLVLNLNYRKKTMEIDAPQGLLNLYI